MDTGGMPNDLGILLVHCNRLYVSTETADCQVINCNNIITGQTMTFNASDTFVVVVGDIEPSQCRPILKCISTFI